MRLAERSLFLPIVLAGTLGIGVVLGALMARSLVGLVPRMLAGRASLLPLPSPKQLSTSFARAAREVEPAVVNINTVSAVHPHDRGGSEAPFGRLFGRYFHFDTPEVPPLGFPQRSLGSGVILDPKGYILTNYHVVTQSLQDKPVDRIKVSVSGDDATSYPAKIVGEDKATDLAVIKIDAGKSLPYATLGDSKSAQVGDWVLAIGSPFGLEDTVTAGIISAKERSIEPGAEGQFKRFIQTDAAINRGNSGGPLVNLAGQVVGINTAIETDTGSYEGVGFAIPSSTVRQVYNDIITRGSVRRGAIGIDFQPAQTPAELRSFGADHGVVVDMVVPGSPADLAGLKLGDVILAIDGKAVRSTNQLVEIVANSNVGSRLRLDYLRKGKEESASVRVAERNKIAGASEPAAQFPRPVNLQGKGEGTLGVLARSVSAMESRALDDSLKLKGQQGVVVDSVDPDGLAADMSVERGDVILEIDHKPIHSMDDFHRLENALQSGHNVLLLVGRREMGLSYATLFLAEPIP